MPSDHSPSGPVSRAREPGKTMHVPMARALLALALIAPLAAAAAPPADTILVNGEVLTMDATRPRAAALAIRGNTIAAVGSDAEIRRLRAAHTQVIDLRGRTVIPGLIDTHIHAIRGGQGFTFENYWHTQTSLASAIDQLRQTAVKRGAGRWVAVTGAWHPAQFSEKRAPTREELSAAMPENPAYVQYLYDYAIVNDKGVEMLGLDTGAELPPGITVEKDAQGRATGKMLGAVGPFSALFARIGARSEADNKESLRVFLAELNKRGVTAIIDPAAGDYGVYSPLYRLWQDKALPVRVAYRASRLPLTNEAAWFRTTLAFLPPRFGDDMLRFLGLGESLVFAMDDGVRMAPGFNPPAEARQELEKVAMLAAERGYPLEAHAYTDDAANAILDVFEKVAAVRPIDKLRWTLTHISSGSERTFERMRRLGMAYTVQMGPYFEAPALLKANSKAVAEASPPTRLALDKGLMVAGGTDATRVGLFNTWHAIQYQVVGRSVGNEVQRRPDLLLSREEALRLYTANAAWITFDEDRRGTLSTGKLADLAVLDAPYLRVPAEAIHQLRSVLTMVDGRIQYLDRDTLQLPSPQRAAGARDRRGDPDAGPQARPF